MICADCGHGKRVHTCKCDGCAMVPSTTGCKGADVMAACLCQKFVAPPRKSRAKVKACGLTLTPLSEEEQAARRPPPPRVLLGARQDTLHKRAGKARAVKAYRVGRKR